MIVDTFITTVVVSCLTCSKYWGAMAPAPLSYAYELLLVVKTIIIQEFKFKKLAQYTV